MKKMIAAALLSCAVVLPATAADVSVEEPWVRATVPQQKVTGAFMRITAQRDARLVAARSPVADRVEIHEMVVEKDIMKMRPVAAIDLPAGKTVELRPGDYHIMLFGLKQPVRAGDTVPLELTVENADGKREALEIAAPVRPLNSMAPGSPMHPD